jgi:hypothetical protein
LILAETRGAENLPGKQYSVLLTGCTCQMSRRII